RVCENSDVELARRNFVSITLNRKRTARAATVEGGQGSKQFCALCSPTFSHSLGQKQTSSREAPMSAVPLNRDTQQGDGYVRLCGHKQTLKPDLSAHSPGCTFVD